MTNARRRLSWALGLIVVVLLAAGVMAPYLLREKDLRGKDPRDEETAEPHVGAKPGPDVLLKETELVGRSGGKLQWRLKARVVEAETSSGAARLEGITEGMLYDKDGLEMTFSAYEALVSDDRRRVSLTGGVNVACPAEELSFGTDVLELDSTRDMVTCPGRVVLKVKGAEVTGDKAALDLATRELTISGNVSIVDRQGGTAGRISAGRVVYSYSLHQLVIDGRADVEFEME